MLIKSYLLNVFLCNPTPKKKRKDIYKERETENVTAELL